jgi:hypothetical protein
LSYIVSFGGGLTSYEALRRTIAKHGRENTVPVFADVGQVRDEQGRVVCGEDDDLYRFMAEVEQLLDIKIHRIKNPDYDNVWDVFFKKRMMGSTRIDPCSAEMKRRPLDEFINSRFMPLADWLVVGLDWTEMGRIEDYLNAVQPWRVYFPLLEEPRLTKQAIADQLRREGIEPPDLYYDGFSHNNCGGACVKAGHAQWYRLWKKRPWVYAYWERREQEFNEMIGKENSILRDRRKIAGKTSTVLTLKALRLRFEAGYVPVKTLNEGCGGACIVWQKGELTTKAA